MAAPTNGRQADVCLVFQTIEPSFAITVKSASTGSLYLLVCPVCKKRRPNASELLDINLSVNQPIERRRSDCLYRAWQGLSRQRLAKVRHLWSGLCANLRKGDYLVVHYCSDII